MLACLPIASRSRAQAPPPDLTVAFIGDQGLGPDAEAVLQLIRDEGADAVLHQGDFDYEDDPAAWDAQINAILGPNFPYFASLGNHDAGAFYGIGGYQELLEARMNRLGIPWLGDLGVQSSFYYQGLFIVLTAPDVFGDGDGFHDLYIRDQLAADDSIWRISSWHKNMRLMQVGDKPDDSGWGVYEESRIGGAIIATAHEHSYSRTHLLSSIQNQTIAGLTEPLLLAADDPATTPDEGRSFVFVSGLAGKSIRPQMLDGPWWASIYTSDQAANHGALFGVFNYQGDPRLAYFYFKDISSFVADQFFVRSTLGAGARLSIDDVSVTEGDAGTVDAVFSVSLVSATGDPVTVEYATGDGSAQGGLDYVPTSGQLSFSGGATTQTVHVTVNGDLASEADETFFVDLTNPTGATLARSRGVGTIRDDEPVSLNVTVSGSGTVELSPPGGLYPRETSVTLTALPAPGFGFSGWSGDLAGSSNPETLVMDTDKHVAASFTALPPGSFSLDVDRVGSGEVITDPPGRVHPFGTVVELTATPGAGFLFAGWSGDLSGSGNPVTISLDDHKLVTATFVEAFTLAVTELGPGSVTLQPPGPVFAQGTEVTLTATPDAGNAFLGWSGALTGKTNPETLIVDTDETVIASFAPPLEFQEVQTGASSDSTTVSTSSDVTAVPGDLYLAAVSSKAFQETLDVSGLGLAWTQLAEQCSGRGQTGVSLWWAQGMPSGSGTVTASFASAPENAVLAVSRYSGADTTLPVGAVATASTLGVSPASCSGGTDTGSYAFPFTTSGDDSVVLVAVSRRNKSHTPGPGYTERVEFETGSGGSVAGLAVSDQGFGAPDSVTVDGAFSGTVDWATVAVEIRQQLPAPAPTPTPTPSPTAMATPSPTPSATPTTAPTATPSSTPTGTPTATPEPTPTPRSPPEILFEEVQTGASSDSTTVSTSSEVTAVAGDLYLAAVSSKSFQETLDVSGLGLAWTQLADQCSGRSQTGMALWWAQGTPSASGPVTASFASAPENAVLAVSRYSGADATLPVGAVATASTLGASPTSCSGGTDATGYAFALTTTGDASVVLVAVTRRAENHTPGPGYTERVEFGTGSGGSVASLAVSDQGFGVADTVAVDGSFSDRVDWAAVAVEIRVASGPPPTATPTPTPSGPAACSDGLDNDGDGLSDFPNDPGCRDAESSPEDPKCDDDQDNDLDGTIDWDGGSAGGVPDPDCIDRPWRTREGASRCGLGFELGLLLPALLSWRRRCRRGAPDRGGRARRLLA